MDGEQFAPEASPEDSSSPGSSPSAYSSSPRDSDIEVSVKKFVENSKISSSSTSSTSSDDEDDENGEDVSGVEEFVEDPVVSAEGLEQGGDSDAPFLDSAGISIPVARASTIDSDDDDDIVGGSNDEEEEDEEGVLNDSNVSGDDSGKGLKIFGVSGPVGSVGIGEVGVEETPKPVLVVKRFSENGGAGEFSKESSVGDASEGINGVLVSGEADKVLEIPRSGSVEALVTDESNVPEEEEGTQMKEEVGTGSRASLDAKEKGEVVEEGASFGSGIDEAEPVNVEPVNEKLEEPVVMELDGQRESVADSVTEESDVGEKVEGEGTKVKGEVAMEEGQVDAIAGAEPAPVLEVKETGEVLGSAIGEVEPVAEKLGEPDGIELAGKGDSVVEAIHANLLPSGAAVVGDAEEDKQSDIKEKDILVVTPINVDNVFDRISLDAEEPKKIAELSMGKIPENTEVEVNDSNVLEADATTMGKGHDQNKSDVAEEKSDILAGDEVASVFEDKEREMVEEGTTLGSGIDEVEPVIIEPVNEKLGEEDVMELGGKGDSVVEAIHVNLLASGAAVIGDVEETKLSEIKEKDSLVGKSVRVDNVFGQIRTYAEEPEKAAEVELNKSNGLETDATSVGQGYHQDMSSDVDVATKDIQNIQNIEAGDDENTTLDLTAEQKPVMEVAPITDSDAKQNEELISSSKVGSGDGDGIEVQSYHAEPMNTDAMDSAKPTEDDHIIVSAQREQLEGKDEAVLESEEETQYPDEDGEIQDSITDEENENVIFGNSEAAKQFLEGLERRSGFDSNSGAEISHDHSRTIDGQIATDSDEDTDEEEDGKELFDSAALTALLKAATGADSDGGNITITSKDGSKLFSVERPAGLGSSLRPMKPPTPWSNRPNLFNPSSLSTGAETEIILSDEEKQKLEKLQQIRVKFLRLVQRLGHSPEDQTAAQVLYRLALVAGRQTNQLFSLDDAKRTAFQLEEEGKDDLNFSLNILVLGKTGVGKSSTINSIFGEVKSQINAFEYATTSVKEISGTVDGVKIRVFDTPGLKSSVFEQGYNRKILSSVKRFTKKCPPDIVLYVDRTDTQTRDLNDIPMLKTITSILGPSIWRSAIVTLTHAASAPPDGPTGNPLSYEAFVAQRSHIVQQSIGQAVGDLRMLNPSSMNPVSLVENHPSCRKNREGLKVLPNGQSWKPHLLFLCYSMKILTEASSVSKPQDPVDHRKLFGFRARSPPLPYLLSWLLQSRTHPKLLTDQGRNDVDSDVFDDDVDQEEEEEEEEEDEYDQLPPFRPLTKEQLKKLTREQRNAYFDEYEYRVKLLQKKQWKEMKKGNVGSDETGNGEGEEGEGDNANDGMVQVPLPDMVLPHSFDGDSPAYRYRFLDPQSQLLTRPVLDTHGWDHDCGYEGVNIEHRALAIKNKYPGSVAVQITKDKKEFNIHLDSSLSAKHGEKGSSMVGFDIQNVGKQLAYIVRAESKFKNLKRNKTTAGASITFLGENIATGVKVEDQVALGKRLMLTGSTGTVRSGSDAAYGANLEVQLREADYPIGQDQSSLGLSLVKWRGDLALGANFQSQVSVGRGSKVTVRAGLNNKRSGQISIALNSTEQLQLALVGIIPLARAIYKALSPGVGGGDSYSMY